MDYNQNILCAQVWSTSQYYMLWLQSTKGITI